MKLDDELTRQLEALVKARGLELLAVETAGNARHLTLRLVIDAPGGVTVDHCASVSREASALLDVEDPFEGRYTLEVTSPGVERKLYSEADYRRFAGRVVKVRMRPSFREHRVVTGELVGLENGVVRVLGDGGVIELPLGEVFEARLQVDWNEIMSEGKCRL